MLAAATTSDAGYADATPDWVKKKGRIAAAPRSVMQETLYGESIRRQVRPLVVETGTTKVAVPFAGPEQLPPQVQVSAPAVELAVAVTVYVPPLTEGEHVLVFAGGARLQLMPDGVLVIDAVAVVTVVVIVTATVELPGTTTHPVGCGDTPLLHGSIPCKFTVTVGEPVEVVNVQLPEPGAPGLLRSALITAVV
jgi:hypothetical protein